LNRNSAGNTLLYTMNEWVSSNPTEDPFDLAKAGFMQRRIYEYSFPYSGSQQEIYGAHYEIIGLTVLVNDELGDSDPNTWTTRGVFPPNADSHPIDGPFGKIELAQAPQATITTPQNGAGFYLGTPVQFDCVVTDDYYLGGSLAYLWNFGDSTSSTSKTVTHTYPSVGLYQVKLRVIDDEGLIDEEFVSVVISEMNYPPKIDSRNPISNSITTIENCSINFSISVSDPNTNDYLHIFWFVNDTENTDFRGLTYFLFPPPNDFFSAGLYRIRATVRDSFGLEAYTSWNLTVLDFERPPKIIMHEPIDFNVRTNETTPVTFRIEYFDPDREIPRIEWYMNGTRLFITSEKNFTILSTPNYELAGFHTITCKVVDEQNSSAFDSITWNLTIDDVNRPPSLSKIEPSGTEATLYEGELFHFSVFAKDLDLEDSQLKVFWYLDNILVNETYSQSPSYIATYDYRPDYNSSGMHIIEVIVVDRYGSKTFQAWDIIVEDVNRKPVVVLSSPSDAQAFSLYEEIIFDASSTYDNDLDPLYFKWDFGDGNFSEGQVTKHRYHSIGEFSVTLNVSDGRSFSTSQFNIGIHAPVLSISLSLSRINITVGNSINISAIVSNSGNEISERNIVRIFVDKKLISNSTIAPVLPGSKGTIECSYKPKLGKRTIFVEILPISHELIICKNASAFINVKAPPSPDYSWLYLLFFSTISISCSCLLAYFLYKRKEKIKKEMEEKRRKELDSIGTLVKPSQSYNHNSQEQELNLPSVEYPKYTEQRSEIGSLTLDRPPEAPKVSLESIIAKHEDFLSLQIAREKIEEIRKEGVFLDDIDKLLDNARSLFEKGLGKDAEKACEYALVCAYQSREKHNEVMNIISEVEYMISQIELMGCKVSDFSNEIKRTKKLLSSGKYSIAKERAYAIKNLVEKASKEKLTSSNYGALKICEFCGMELDESWNECPNCAGNMSSKCPYCSSPIEPDFIQCPYCNTELKKVKPLDQAEEDKVKDAIYEASSAILDAEKENKNVAEAKNTLVLAVSFLRSRKYEKALRYAKKAKELAINSTIR
ncbi:MAG: PKD domain-containing protein, partial [Thermoplasmata archaeon]